MTTGVDLRRLHARTATTERSCSMDTMTQELVQTRDVVALEISVDCVIQVKSYSRPYSRSGASAEHLRCFGYHA